jgi:hypothetical protein
MTLSYCPEIRPIDWLNSDPVEIDWYKHKKEATGQLNLDLIGEIVAKVMANVPEIALEQRFREQADKWARETQHLSSPTQKAAHPSYQAILGMGSENKKEVVRLLLLDLQQNRRAWFWALSYLTADNPIGPEDAGRMERMVGAWVNWGKEKGLL